MGEFSGVDGLVERFELVLLGRWENAGSCELLVRGSWIVIYALALPILVFFASDGVDRWGDVVHR